MRLLILIFISTFLFSCSTVKKIFEPKSDYEDVHTNHQATAQQRLIPRPGYEGMLTNQVCTKWEGNNCISKSVQTYDMNSQQVRSMLVDFKFACKLGGKRYRICLPKAGYCRNEGGCIEWKRKLITRKKYCAKEGIVKQHFVPITDHQYLISGALECMQGY